MKRLEYNGSKRLSDLSIAELKRLLRDDVVCRKIAYTVTHMDGGDLMDALSAMGFDAVKVGTILAEDSDLRDRLMEHVGEESRLCFMEMVPLVKVKALKSLYDALSSGKGLEDRSTAKMCDIALKSLEVFMRHGIGAEDDMDEYEELMDVFKKTEGKKKEKVRRKGGGNASGESSIVRLMN